MKLTRKWVLRAKQGLRKSGFKDKNWSHLEGGNKPCRRKERRRVEEEEEESGIKAKKVWKLTLIMNSMRFGMDLWVCMMIILLKPRVF